MNVPRAKFTLKIIIATVLVPLVIVELVVRLNPIGIFGSAGDPYHHLRDEDLHPIEFDSDLGWVPRPGQYDDVWPGKALSISSDGLRSNGARFGRNRSPSILAAGDSFTFGDLVADSETWPAYLEQMLGATTYNAGVSSYGFDQTVLRVEKLVPKLLPTVVIVGVINDDIRRTTVSSRSNATKPFFRLVNGALALDSEPLQPFPGDARVSLRLLLRRSAISRLLYRRWLSPEVKQHEDGVGVSCALTRRLAQLKKRYEVPVLLLAQMDEALGRRDLVQLQRCAEDAGLDVIDTYWVLKNYKTRDDLWRVHMTAAGNRVVAGIVYRYLQSSRYAHLLTAARDK